MYKEVDVCTEDGKFALIKCAETALNSKLLSHYKSFFANMIVKAVERLDNNLLDRDLIGIK
jgi:T-complex protein 1 subunit eta